MVDSLKPIVIVSRCLRGEYCRWNGEIINDDFTKRLSAYVEFMPICPEMEIGLGVPRDPIHIVSDRSVLGLVQPATGIDVTGSMLDFCESFLGSLDEVDGFLLKFRSPSCGANDVKIYPASGKSGSIGKGAGFFGGAVLARFPDLAVETEGRVKSYRIREHYLTRLFTMARWRNTAKYGSMKDLVDFHADHKLLLMAYNQAELKQLGAIVANHEHRPVHEVFDLYRSHLAGAMRRAPRYTSNINVCMHAMGYFSKDISAREKSYFLDSLERYRRESLPLSAVINIINAWIARFDQPYLEQQVYFHPYPEEMAFISDSGKGREL
jgi:uncharacterized protein YbgA (DUF1722 family)/uncharacterized protein YbbK (DUF523 family)